MTRSRRRRQLFRLFAMLLAIVDKVIRIAAIKVYCEQTGTS